jgi:hypothetical protein
VEPSTSVGAVKVAAVTTFSQEGYQVYGKRFIDSFIEFWPEAVQLNVFYEGEKPTDANPNCVWHSLDADPDRKRFMERHPDEDPKDYRKCPTRFCHKVFAVTSESVTDAQYVMWIDADCETFRKVTEADIEAVCPERGRLGSFLGRPYHRHTETGFWCVDRNACGDDFLDEFRRMYTSGELLLMREWHDCMAFDFVVRKFERAGYRFQNLAKGARGLDVFEQSPLKGFIRHNKGPVAKRDVYGGVANDIAIGEVA